MGAFCSCCLCPAVLSGSPKLASQWLVQPCASNCYPLSVANPLLLTNAPPDLQRSHSCRLLPARGSQHWGGATRDQEPSAHPSRCSRCGADLQGHSFACRCRLPSHCRCCCCCVSWVSCQTGPSLAAPPAPAVQLELALRPLRVCQRVFPKIPGYRKPDNTLFCAGGQCGAAAGGMQKLP